MSSSSWTTADMPDLTGRTAVVTGANTGLGLETAAELAAHGARTVLAVRNTDKGEAAIATILERHPDADVSVQALDLSDLSSIRAAAAQLLDAHDRIDLLINNAGVMYTPKSTTADGFELQMGTNHLGHFALTGLLLPRLLDTDDSRVVSVSSVGHRIRSRIDVDKLASTDDYDRVSAYGRSKLANLLFTYELQRRLASADASTRHSPPIPVCPRPNSLATCRRSCSGAASCFVRCSKAPNKAHCPRCVRQSILRPSAASTTDRTGSARHAASRRS